MKYCAKCGAEVSENSKFCEKCGNKMNMDFPDNRNKKIRVGKIVAATVVVVAAIIAVAGYLQHSRSQKDSNLAKEASADTNGRTNEISDEDMYSAVDIFTDTEDSEESQAGKENAQANGEGAENPGEAVLSSTNVDSIDFTAKVKLNREQVRSYNKESLLEIINNAGIGEEQKQDAINAMIAMTDIAEWEVAAEMLLEAKGFTDVVVSITDGSADVVLNMGEVTDAKRAQVEDIVKRKTNIAAENIIITPIQNQAKEGDSTEENEAAIDAAEGGEDAIEAEDDNVKYIDGAYTSSIQLNDNTVDIEVVVEKNHITSITLVNMDETMAAMYPLVQPALDNLTQQIYKKQSLENISCGDANQYTSMVLLNAIESALDKARYEKE